MDRCAARRLVQAEERLVASANFHRRVCTPESRGDSACDTAEGARSAPVELCATAEVSRRRPLALDRNDLLVLRAWIRFSVPTLS